MGGLIAAKRFLPGTWLLIYYHVYLFISYLSPNLRKVNGMCLHLPLFYCSLRNTFWSKDNIDLR